MPVAGGGGEQAMTVLRARVTAGNPPTAVQMLGFDIPDWAKQGVVGDLDEVADKEGWDKVVPAALQDFSKYDGKWIAAPVNVHSTNWMWANKAVLDAAGGKAPETLGRAHRRARQDQGGRRHADRAWRPALAGRHHVRGVVVSTGGTEFYKKALIDLDPAALGSDTMKKVFDRMTKLRGYVDDNFSGRDWNLASAMVIKGKAGMQFMGDWAKGEFINAGKKPGTDFVCVRFPGTQGTVIFNSDQFVMFKVGDDKQDAQLEDGLRHRGPGLPGRLQRGEGLGAGAHRRSGRRIRRLRQEGHGRPGRSQHQAARCSARWRTATPRRRRSRTPSTTS